MIEGINEIEQAAAPFLAQRAQRREQRRLKVAGLSLRHIKLLVYQWLLRALSGWADGLLYRDAGERGLRSFFGPGNVPLFFLILAFGVVLGTPGVIFAVIFLWAFALHLADRLAARYRRQHEQSEGYLYSYFIGWPRFLPATREASRWQQGAILAAIGAILFAWDHSGGLLLIVAGASVCALQRVARLIEREEISDVLDAEWMQSERETVKAQTTGEAQSQELTEEDYILRYS